MTVRYDDNVGDDIEDGDDFEDDNNGWCGKPDRETEGGAVAAADDMASDAGAMLSSQAENDGTLAAAGGPGTVEDAQVLSAAVEGDLPVIGGNVPLFVRGSCGTASAS